MKLLALIEFLRSRLKTVVRLSLALLALLVLLDALFVDKKHADTWIEHIPGFWAAWGFLGCIVLILVSKWFGHRGIMVREDYYDE